MKIRKGRLSLLHVGLSILAIASAGLYWWYAFVLANISIIDSFSFPLIMVFVFIAGIVSFFLPYGLALLPAVFSIGMLLGFFGP